MTTAESDSAEYALTIYASNLERENADLKAQVKAWEDKAGEVMEYPQIHEQPFETDPTLIAHFVSKAAYDACRAALVVARKENERLKVMCNNSLANNLCPDHRDKQAGKPCLACEIERIQGRLGKVNEEREIMRQGDLIDSERVANGVLREKWRAAEAESAGMRKGLEEARDWMSHDWSCPTMQQVNVPCECGYDKAKARIDALLAPRREKEQQPEQET